MSRDEQDAALAEIAQRRFNGITPEKLSLETAIAMMEAFTLGEDNGRSGVLERVDQLFAPKLAEVRAESVSKSMRALERWCLARSDIEPGRSYTSRPGPTGCWLIAIYGGMRQPVFSGADQADALAQAAQWCEGELIQARCSIRTAHESG